MIYKHIEQFIYFLLSVFFAYLCLTSPKFLFAEISILDSDITYNEMALFFAASAIFFSNIFFRKKIFIYFLLLIVFCILRFGEVYHYEFFGFGYEPVTISNINYSSIEIFLGNYYPYVIFLFTLLFLFFRFLWNFRTDLNKVALLFSLLLILRGVYQLDRWDALKSGLAKRYSSEISLFIAYSSYHLSSFELNHFEKKILDEIYVYPKKEKKIKEKKNIFLIYLESFSHGYLNEEITPNLHRISKTGIVFENFYNSTTPTINSMVASQCSIYPRLGFQGGSLGKYNNFTCLSDYLKDNGYYLRYMQAADKNFSRKSDFYFSHQYDEFWGEDEIDEFYPEISQQEKNFWGVYDRQLLELAGLEIEKMKDKQPFLFSMININTHTPGFFSKECSINEGKREIKAIKCFDFYFKNFFEGIKDKFPNSIMIITGDHVAGPNNHARLYVEDENIESSFDKTLMIILDFSQEFGHKVDKYGSTVDLYPTVIDLLGGVNKEIYFGKSLLSSRSSHQNIITPDFQINGHYKDFPKTAFYSECYTEKTNENFEKLNNCTRKRVFTYFDSNLNSFW